MVAPIDRPAPTAAAFEALRARFVAGLPLRWQEIAHGAEPAQRLQALHRLAGVAGSYGLDAIGAAARAAEQALAGGDAAAFDCALARLRDLLAGHDVTVR